MTTDGGSPAAGWYPDPFVPGGRRWWDGMAWTGHVAAPAAPTAPTGVAVHTPYIWVTALMPLLSLVLVGSFDWRGYVTAGFDREVYSPYDGLGMATGYPVLLAASWLLTALGVVAGYLDWRELGRRGFGRRFHWAWSFLGSVVYTIGRSVVVRRSTGRGSSTLWVAVIAAVVGSVGSFATVIVSVVGGLGELATRFR